MIFADLNGIQFVALCIMVAAVFMLARIHTAPNRPTPTLIFPSCCLSPLRFRKYRRSDLEQCLELYRLNEPGRFPPGKLNDYWRVLANESAYFLVLEECDRIIATGGLMHIDVNNTNFCYGLIHPEFQGRGIGTALLYARFALLDLPGGSAVHGVSITYVEGSIGFYQRFGFAPLGTITDESGLTLRTAYVVVNQAGVEEVRELLKREHIEVPLEDMSVIPVYKSPQ
jgi:[ribosomal protein S18]-alanine N-acetyltransferase